MGVRVSVANLFLDQSIGIDDTNTFQLKKFQLKFLSSMVGGALQFLFAAISPFPLCSL